MIKKTVASDGESKDDNKDDNFVVAMTPPAKKATTKCWRGILNVAE
jgi:hypothetical protein